MIECKAGDIVVVESQDKKRLYEMEVVKVFKNTITGYADNRAYVYKTMNQIVENLGPKPEEEKLFKWWWQK